MSNSSASRTKDFLIDPKNIYVNITALLTIIGFVFWLSNVHSITMQNEKELSSIRLQIKEIDTKTSEKLHQMNLNMVIMNRSLGSIEGKLELIVKGKANH